ncbi:hypothetical protein V1286_005069 [Bradyrhizobium algeriense]|uniref:Uncharacterized protein n=1 Tax=Bradyrhizobium algeriense TaxID=634784 RepID=A0ABU8BGE1_9BRAD
MPSAQRTMTASEITVWRSRFGTTTAPCFKPSSHSTLSGKDSKAAFGARRERIDAWQRRIGAAPQTPPRFQLFAPLLRPSHCTCASLCLAAPVGPVNLGPAMSRPQAHAAFVQFDPVTQGKLRFHRRLRSRSPITTLRNCASGARDVVVLDHRKRGGDIVLRLGLHLAGCATIEVSSCSPGQPCVHLLKIRRPLPLRARRHESLMPQLKRPTIRLTGSDRRIS